MQIPLQTRLPKTYRILSMKKETEFVTTMTLPISLGAKPGQFVMAWLPGVEEIPMSVALDDGKQLTITFFAVGETTKRLAQCRKGDLVGLRGPFGTSYEWKPKQHLALVAGGYGAAPMYFAGWVAAAEGCTLEVFVGARSAEHLLYLNEFKKLPKTTLHIATDDGSAGFKGFNVQLLQKILQEKKLSDPSTRSARSGSNPRGFDQLFACGPERMLVAVSDLSFQAKIPSQLSLERYMKCGYGLCGNCVVDPLGIRLCVDGPVVRNEICRKITEFGKCHRDGLGKKHAI